MKYPRTGKRGAPQAFARKLYEILESETCDCASWNDAGNAFFVKDIERFSNDILMRYFRHNKFASFQRQLNLYGFRKVNRGVDAGAYAHQYFRKGQPDLLILVRRAQSPVPSPTVSPVSQTYSPQMVGNGVFEPDIDSLFPFSNFDSDIQSQTLSSNGIISNPLFYLNQSSQPFYSSQSPTQLETNNVHDWRPNLHTQGINIQISPIVHPRSLQQLPGLQPFPNLSRHSTDEATISGYHGMNETGPLSSSGMIENPLDFFHEARLKTSSDVIRDCSLEVLEAYAENCSFRHKNSAKKEDLVGGFENLDIANKLKYELSQSIENMQLADPLTQCLFNSADHSSKSDSASDLCQFRRVTSQDWGHLDMKELKVEDIFCDARRASFAQGDDNFQLILTNSF